MVKEFNILKCSINSIAIRRRQQGKAKGAIALRQLAKSAKTLNAKKNLVKNIILRLSANNLRHVRTRTHNNERTNMLQRKRRLTTVQQLRKRIDPNGKRVLQRTVHPQELPPVTSTRVQGALKQLTQPLVVPQLCRSRGRSKAAMGEGLKTFGRSDSVILLSLTRLRPTYRTATVAGLHRTAVEAPTSTILRDSGLKSLNLEIFTSELYGSC
ncbi:hypothetical protein EVAR_40191_1 [Eumeta japonica]|uniref:Uncharacterized protein n=1 Tax=Eumeta variegata TaxID=151549 RepID=A0A4C1XLF1_EUMVA|nr:hypothetical protein EVAR_40191_1 [Eumeta japonica]